MSVYNKVLNEIKTQRSIIENIQKKIKILEDDNIKTEDRSKENLILENNNVNKLVDNLEIQNIKTDINSIKEEVSTLKTQITDLVAILESIMKINK